MHTILVIVTRAVMTLDHQEINCIVINHVETANNYKYTYVLLQLHKPTSPASPHDSYFVTIAPSYSVLLSGHLPDGEYMNTDLSRANTVVQRRGHV